MRPDLEFRALNAADLSAYKQLMLAGYQQDSESFVSSVAERSALPDSWWLQRIAAENRSSIGYGVFDGAELIATLVLERSQRPKTAHKAMIHAVYVRADWRGQGLAADLLQTTIALARSQGVLHLSLSVLEGNQAAQRLYQRVGFIEYGCEPMAVQQGQRYLSKHLLWQAL